MLKNFRTYQLAVQLYHSTQKIKITGAMKDQLDRASLSVVLNLAEGSGKPSPRDKKRFYSIAMGSLRETQAILQLTHNCEDEKLADIIGAHIYKLIQNPI